MRSPLLAITAVAAAFATSNANATDDTIICHFAGHEFRMESKVDARDKMSGEYDMYRDGSYVGLWHYELDVENKVYSLGSPDKSMVLGGAFPASIRPDQIANGIPMPHSLFIIVSTKQETPGDCTMYIRR